MVSKFFLVKLFISLSMRYPFYCFWSKVYKIPWKPYELIIERWNIKILDLQYIFYIRKIFSVNHFFFWETSVNHLMHTMHTHSKNEFQLRLFFFEKRVPYVYKCLYNKYYPTNYWAHHPKFSQNMIIKKTHLS